MQRITFPLPLSDRVKCLLSKINPKCRSEVGKAVFFSTETSKANRHDFNLQLLRRYRQRMVRGPDPVESPRLTPQMVTSILQTNEVSAQSTNGVVQVVHCNQLQANKPIEDRRAEGKLQGTNKFLFGVYDGHAGCACAQNLKERLFQYVAVAMADKDSLHHMSQGGMDDAQHYIEDLSSSLRTDITPELATLHWQSLLTYINESLEDYRMDSTVEEKITKSFLRLDQDMSTEAMCHTDDRGLSSDAINIAFSGAVGCVAFIDGLDLYVANVGDTQAVLGSHNKATEQWQATLMTHEHDADNQNEVKQLYKNHPNESVNILKGGRLFGELMPLRAFGDVRYKWSDKDFLHLKEIIESNADPDLAYFKHMTLPKNYRTPPYLHATPEIIHHRLSPKDRFLVIASDGLWDAEGMTPHSVVNLVRNHTEGQQTLARFQPKESMTLKSVNDRLWKRKHNLAKRAVDENSATHLIRHALGLEHGQLSAQLTLPQPLVRYYRDDITITVIYFDHRYINDFTLKH